MRCSPGSGCRMNFIVTRGGILRADCSVRCASDWVWRRLEPLLSALKVMDWLNGSTAHWQLNLPSWPVSIRETGTSICPWSCGHIGQRCKSRVSTHRRRWCLGGSSARRWTWCLGRLPSQKLLVGQNWTTLGDWRSVWARSINWPGRL